MNIGAAVCHWPVTTDIIETGASDLPLLSQRPGVQKVIRGAFKQSQYTVLFCSPFLNLFSKSQYGVKWLLDAANECNEITIRNRIKVDEIYTTRLASIICDPFLSPFSR